MFACANCVCMARLKDPRERAIRGENSGNKYLKRKRVQNFF
jgi:hypothetical protein